MRKTMETCRTQLIIWTRIPCSDIFELIHYLLVITYKLWVQPGQKCYSNDDSGKKFYSVRNISLRINKHFNLFLLIRLLIVFKSVCKAFRKKLEDNINKFFLSIFSNNLLDLNFSRSTFVTPNTPSRNNAKFLCFKVDRYGALIEFLSLEWMLFLWIKMSIILVFTF